MKIVEQTDLKADFGVFLAIIRAHLDFLHEKANYLETENREGTPENAIEVLRSMKAHSRQLANNLEDIKWALK